MQEEACLIVKDLEVGYGNNSVLENINFSLTKGEICGLLGPNGSGKTTLLKSINGILGNGQGSIWVDRKNLKTLTRKAIAGLMAVVPQNTSTQFSFTVLQIVLMAGSARYGMLGKPGKIDYKHAQDILDEIGIADLASRVFNELSGGERQLVLIARALFQSPKILLLDEPIAHLDFKKQYSIMQIIRKMTLEKKLATMITMHDPNLAGRYCHRLIMLKQGRIVYQGSKNDVFNADALNATYDIKVRVECTCDGVQYVLPLESKTCH